MICPNCKSVNPDTNRFCTTCSTQLVMNVPDPRTAAQTQPQTQFQPQSQGQAQTQTQQVYTPPVYTPPVKKKMSGAKLAIIIGSVVGGIALVAVFVLYLLPLITGSNKQKNRVEDYLNQVEDAFNDASDKLDGIDPGDYIIDSDQQGDTPVIPVTPSDPYDEYETDNSPRVTCPYTLMNVTSKLGLNVRQSPDTSSPVVAVLLQDRHVFVEKTANNWAYIRSGDVSGWCSLDYLVNVPMQSKAYTEKEIENAKNEALIALNAYVETRPAGGRTDITTSNVIEYFESSYTQFAYNDCFGEQFEKLIPVAASANEVYYYVDDSRYKTIDDVANKYFATFSDEVASECLAGKLMMLDGRLAIAQRADHYTGCYIDHSYNTVQVSPTQIDIHITVQEYYESSLSRDSSGKALPSCPVYTNTYTVSCIVEDGVWVFDNMQMIFD